MTNEFKRKYLPSVTILVMLIFTAYIIIIAPKGTPRTVIQETCEVLNDE